MGSYVAHQSNRAKVTDENKIVELIDKYDIPTAVHKTTEGGERFVQFGTDTLFSAMEDNARKFLKELGEECLETPLLIRTHEDPYGDRLIQVEQWVAYPDGTVEKDTLGIPEDVEMDPTLWESRRMLRWTRP